MDLIFLWKFKTYKLISYNYPSFSNPHSPGPQKGVGIMYGCKWNDYCKEFRNISINILANIFGILEK